MKVSENILTDFDTLHKERQYLKQYCKERGIDKVGAEYYIDIGDVTYVVTPRPPKVSTPKMAHTYMEPNLCRHKYVYIKSVQANLPKIYEALMKGLEVDENGNIL